MANNARYNALYGPLCYTDMEGVAHAIDIEAESLYEAVAISVAEFRQDELNQSMPAPMTEFTVAIYRGGG